MIFGLFKRLVGNGVWAGSLAADTKTGIVAAANAQTGATQLTASVNVVSTAVAGVTDSVILPQPAGAGESMLICNDDDGAIDVYPHVGGYLNGGAQNAGVSLAAGKRLLLVAESTSKWATFTSS